MSTRGWIALRSALWMVIWSSQNLQGSYMSWGFVWVRGRLLYLVCDCPKVRSIMFYPCLLSQKSLRIQVRLGYGLYQLLLQPSQKPTVQLETPHRMTRETLGPETTPKHDHLRSETPGWGNPPNRRSDRCGGPALVNAPRATTDTP